MTNTLHPIISPQLLQLYREVAYTARHADDVLAMQAVNTAFQAGFRAGYRLGKLENPNPIRPSEPVMLATIKKIMQEWEFPHDGDRNIEEEVVDYANL